MAVPRAKPTSTRCSTDASCDPGEAPMDDLLAEFLTESAESIGALGNDLVRLEQNPEDPTLVGNIFRLMHTIKGTCGFLGLSRLEKTAHAAENVLGRIRDREIVVTPDVVSLILES